MAHGFYIIRHGTYFVLHDTYFVLHGTYFVVHGVVEFYWSEFLASLVINSDVSTDDRNRPDAAKPVS